MEERIITVFADKTDFDYEMGKAANGNTVYPSLQALKSHVNHNIDVCGIVELEVRLKRVVQEARRHTHEELACGKQKVMEREKYRDEIVALTKRLKEIDDLIEGACNGPR